MRITRRGYSVNPWRLVRDNGAEIEVPQGFYHPLLGQMEVFMSISGSTKREVTEKALALLESLLDERQQS